ncbi:NACHT domain-containing NTPase [Streptomyces sp. R11]|uniref:NACHT domain-containing NTPase n=1 Tax=Streptomyces sp. R11 TaxID=3238625 RepID=A0AB39NBD3_9ACTN
MDRLAESLAQESKLRCGEQHRQLLGDRGRLIAPIDLGFDAEGERGLMTPLARHGRMSGITTFYQTLPSRRLVITGSPGAGKTFMAIELVLGLLTCDDRSKTDPVPVRLTLTDWDTDTDFGTWLAKRLAAEYRLSLHGAQELVAARRIIPVLDGLDELDAIADPHAATPRAIAAVEALNRYLDGKNGAPFVLTCRSWRYRALVAAGHGVRGADRIQICPVTAGQARTYLTERRRHAALPDRWPALLNTLGPEADATPPDWLSTPWRLTMVSTVYARDGDPSELIARQRDGVVDEYLLNLYIPEAVAMHPSAPQSRYSAADTERWLAHLARYLHQTGKQSIVLHELWGLGRGWKARALAGLVGTVLGMLTLLLLLSSDRSADAYMGHRYDILIAALIGAGLGGFAAFDPSGPRVLHFARVDQRSEAVAAFRVALRWCLLSLLANALGLAAFVWAYDHWPLLHDAIRREVDGADSPLWPDGLLLLFVFIVLGGLPTTFLTACRYLLVSGIAARTGKRPVVAASPQSSSIEVTDPRAPLRGVLLTGAAVLAALITLTFLAFTVFPVWARFAVWLPLYLVGLTALPESARWYVWYVTFRLWARDRLPLRTGVFCDWACEAGLLRVSGHAYEFRHRELQDWLMASPERPPSAY